MGVIHEAQALVRWLALPPGFTVCEFGTQEFRGPGTAEEFYRGLDAGSYDTVDLNEHATIHADLNEPLEHEPSIS
jgi:hypothetical protein